MRKGLTLLTALDKITRCKRRRSKWAATRLLSYTTRPVPWHCGNVLWWPSS